MSAQAVASSAALTANAKGVNLFMVFSFYVPDE